MRHASGKAVRSSGGRPVRAGNLHVTLAFLGVVPEARLVALAAIARQAAASCLGGGPLAFDHLEYWRAAQLLCALPTAPPAWTADLARGLQDLSAGRGLVGFGITRQFRPHVTLARGVQCPPSVMQMQPVTWGFTDFVLVDSKTLPEGSVYTVLERFSFRH